jgi:hypothetical protein
MLEDRLLHHRRLVWRRLDLGLGFRLRHGHGFRRLHQPGRRQRGCHRLGGLGRLLRGHAFLAFDDRRFGEDVAAWQRDTALAGEPVHELARDDLFNRARGALDLDAVIALEQRSDFLAGGAKQLCDLVNPHCCQR